MIRGVHTMLYTSEPEALREFIREKLGFPSTDVGDGWLIFDLPEADMGCHAADNVDGKRSGTHNISFYCDDIRVTVAQLKQRGVEFVDEITDQGFGLVTFLKCLAIVLFNFINHIIRRSRLGWLAKLHLSHNIF